jgi:hypothetical protein
MKKFAQSKILVLPLLLLFAGSSFTATGQPVAYKSGDETVRGILYAP